MWAFAADAANDPLWTESEDQPDGRVRWSYHVAPFLVVRTADGVECETVIDPVLFDRPVPIEEWLVALHDKPTVVKTDLGEPPIPARGGSGYWPAPDPVEGPDVHARETLEEYANRNI